MSLHPQPLQNNMLASLKQQAGAKITGSIQRASTKTGVDFAYLMQQANAESSFRPDIKAKTSSATGLFQFIDKTWLSMVEQYGAEYGIDTTQPKSDLLKLRNDPKISSYMAGELANENKNTLKMLLGEGTQIGSTELYFAHFMGASRAAGFLKAHAESPSLKGADLFPKEAQANKAIFFDHNHRPRTLSEIYAKFDQKFKIEGENAPVAQEPVAQDIVYVPQAISPSLDFFIPTQQTSLSSFTAQIKTQYGLGHLLHNPADLLWLTVLEDKSQSG